MKRNKQTSSEPADRPGGSQPHRLPPHLARTAPPQPPLRSGCLGRHRGGCSSSIVAVIFSSPAFILGAGIPVATVAGGTTAVAITASRLMHHGGPARCSRWVRGRPVPLVAIRSGLGLVARNFQGPSPQQPTGPHRRPPPPALAENRRDRCPAGKRCVALQDVDLGVFSGTRSGIDREIHDDGTQATPAPSDDQSLTVGPRRPRSCCRTTNLIEADGELQPGNASRRRQPHAQGRRRLRTLRGPPKGRPALTPRLPYSSPAPKTDTVHPVSPLWRGPSAGAPTPGVTPRGFFALKMYTSDGQLRQSSATNTPVFPSIRDPMKFQHFIRSPEAYAGHQPA